MDGWMDGWMDGVVLIRSLDGRIVFWSRFAVVSARVAVGDLEPFFSLFFGSQKSDFLEPSGIARILPEGQNFLRSPKKQEFSVEFCRFFGDSCGESFQGRFLDEKSMKNR